MSDTSKIKQDTLSTDLKTSNTDTKNTSELGSKDNIPTPVNHPNFIPDPKSRKDSSAEYGDVKGKPPIGSNGSSDSNGKSKVQYNRTESHDQKTRGSVVSFGSCDSKTNEEEVVITYQDEAIDIDEVGTGTVSTSQKTPVRLVIISSKMRNTSAIRQNLQPNVVLIQYKYDNSTLDQILGLVAGSLGQQRCETAALIFSCSGLSIQLCSKDGKAQLLTKETITESQYVQEFFTSLVNSHMVKSGGARLDFLGCNLLLHTDGGAIDKEIETLVKIPVKFYKDLGGGEYIKTLTDEGTVKSSCSVGEMYFKLEKLRGWINQQQQTLAGFEKIQTVGKGAYGAAVLYKKKDDDSLVILKEINMHDLNASERQMALNEVNILAMLEHPNIISYYDSFEEDGVIMIEMEYADGGTLAQYLSSQDKSLEERQILLLFQQILAAIRHIHEHNILHRDLKTANIFLTKEGVVKVGDFGISKMMSTVNKGANTVLGTPYYISPEMCEGKPYNHKSDIWALGCILYEMACLQKTFEGSNLPALVNKIMKGQFAPVKDTYSQGFKDLIMLMLSQNPDLRPSANDVLYSDIPKLLEQCEEDLSENEDEATVRTNSSNTKKKTRTVLYYFDSATVEITPIELNPRLKIRSTAVGADHVIVVTIESQVFTWGEGSKGQLGHGDMESLMKPKQVEALRGKSITRSCCGEGFSVFASDRGIVLTCGDGSRGCLGHGDLSSVLRPQLIESLLSVDVVSVACGQHHVSVVGSEGEVFAWGEGKDGKLGLGDEENHCQPVRVGISEPVLISDVFCGVDGTMFLTDVGSVFACGNNSENKLGLNNRHGFIAAMRNIFTRCEVEGQKVPTSVRALARHKVLDISMGRHHTAVIVEPGHVYTFGRNVEGQLGIEGIKPANAPVEVKAMSDKHVVRVQCGDHYTVSSTNQNNEIFYWGLRFRDQGSPNPDPNTTSRDSLNKDDMRIESVTPRNASHSRQASSTSGISLNSNKENEGNSPTDKDVAPNETPERQVSIDSNVSLTDSGYTGDASTAMEVASRTGFRPLSNVPRRSTSANSRENTKEKEKEADKDTSQIIYPPDHLMQIIPGEEMLTLTSFYCHGENIFIQVDTTAPPPRRKSRKKRGIRKRFSGSTLPVPTSEKGMSASSREGGDEYSSEASEMDTQGTVPAWLRQELAMSENDVNDGNLADDTSGQSDEEKGHLSIESSMSSIQFNRDLAPYKSAPDNNLTPRNNFTSITVTGTTKKTSPRDVRVRSFSNSTESEVSNQSDGSNKDLKQASSECPTRTTLLRPTSTKVTSGSKGRGNSTGARAKSAVGGNSQWGHNRLRRGYTGNDIALKEQLAARGFVSDVTVKKREEALLGELRMTREEKLAAEQRVKELEQVHRKEQDRLRLEAEQKAIERERLLQEQILMLREELQNQNSQLQSNQKIVSSLQAQLDKAQKKKKKLGGSAGGGGGGGGGSSESKVCTVQ